MKLHLLWIASLTLLAVFALAGLGRTTGAQAKKGAQPVKTPASDAHVIEEPWRPSAEKAFRAELDLGKRGPEQRALLNALRILCNRVPDAAEVAPQNRLPTLPELGTGVSGNPFAPELALRLAALLRAGFPAAEALHAEVTLFLDAARSAADGGFANALLELLVCDAVHSREETEFVTLQARADTLARQVCARLAWTVEAPDAAPSATQIRDLACEAICRRLASANGWVAELPDGWADVVESLCQRLREDGLWSEAGTGVGNEATEATSTLWLGALLSMAAHEKGMDVSKGMLGRRYAAALQFIAKAANNACARGQPRMDLDGAALFAMFAGEMEPKSLKPLQEGLRSKAIQHFGAVDFRPSGLALAVSTGWLVERPMPSPELYLPPSTLDDAHYVAQLSLTLIGYCGGLGPAGKCVSVGTPAEFYMCSQALAVLDAHNTPHLQDKISTAITLAATWLKARQQPDGTFAGEYSARLGGHCLNLLALLDSGMARKDDCIQKGLRVLPSLALGQPTAQLDGPVYGYAVALLFFQKYYETEQQAANVFDAADPGEYKKATAKVWRQLKADHRALVEKMVETLTEADHGFGWSYFGPATHDGTEIDFGDTAWRDNSNSQYAVMGLKAASLLGAPFDRAILAAEAKRLIRCYKPDATMPAIEVKLAGDDDKKRTGTSKTGKIVPGGWDYTSPTTPQETAAMTATGMTAAGISSLVICRDELRLHGQLESGLQADIDLHIHGGLHWIGSMFGYRHYRGLATSRIYAEGWGKYYDMYSIERAGVLSNVRMMADVEWYAEGARLLVETQQIDGAWPDIVGMNPLPGKTGPDTVDHCFAILFLKRAVVPVTSRPVITQDD